MAFEDLITGLVKQADPELAPETGPISTDMLVERLARKGIERLNRAPAAQAADFGADDEVVQPEASPARAPKVKPPKADLSFGDADELVTPPSTPAPQTETIPLPTPRPAEAPPRPPAIAPTAAMPEVQPLDAAPFRSGGRAIDSVTGAESGMLTGTEAYDTAKARTDAAERGLTEARANAEAARKTYEESLMTAPLTGDASDVVVKRNLRKQARLGEMEMRLKEAEAEVESARKAPLPTQTGTRDTLERIPDAATGLITDTARGVARAGVGALRASDAAVSWLGGIQPGTDTFDAADKTLDAAARDVKTYVGQDLFKKDEAQNERLGSKLVQGVVSTGVFAAGGAAGRALSLSPTVTTALLGAFPQAEQQFQQAQSAADISPDYARAWMKNYGIDVSKEQANAMVRWSMFSLGLGIGATEAIPIGHMFERLEKASGGGLTRYLGVVAAQAGEEAVQEGVQQLLQNAATLGLLDPNQKIDKDVAENMLVGALSGGLVTGVLAAPSAIRNQVDTVRNRLNVPVPEQEVITPEQIVQQITGMPAAADAPQPAGPQPATPEEISNKPNNDGQIQPVPAPEEITPPTSSIDEPALLRAYGYNDEQIADLSPSQRATEVAEAIQSGINPSDFGAGDTAVGSRSAPVQVETADDIARAASVVNAEPTEAQKVAGNYQKQHVKWNGLDITIENPKGSNRSGKSPDGSEWSVTMPGHYGYLKRTTGADGDQVDVYVGDHLDAKAPVYIVDQKDAETGKFDEHKVIMGARSEDEARALYEKGFSDGLGAQRNGGITAMSPEEFKAWLKTADTTKPLIATKAVTAAAAKRKTDKPKSESPVSLLQFIASKGGLKPDGDLTAMDAHKHRVQIPGRKGFFGLIKKDGLSLDYMREAAEEAGYFRSDRPNGSSLTEFLDAIDEELRGRPRFAEAELGVPTQRELDRREDERLHREAILEQNRKAIEEMADTYGIPSNLLNQEDVWLAAEIMEDEGLDPDDALERAAIRNLEKMPEPMATADEISDTFGWGATDAVQPEPAQEDVEAASSEGGDDGRSSEEGGRAVARADLSGTGDDRARPGEGEAGQEAERAEQAPDEGPSADSGLEFGAADDEVAPRQQPKKSKKPTKEEKDEAKRKADNEARENELQRKLAELPSDIDAIVKDYKSTIDEFDDAMRAGDEEARARLSERLDLLEIKANGGTRSGVATQESDAEKVRNAASAPIGSIPKWGQRGVFMLTVDGMDFIVTHNAGSGPAIYAAHQDQPFPSSTGYWSMLGQSGGVGKSVEDMWRERIADYIEAERSNGKKKEFGTPEAWYRLPDNYDDSGYPENVGNNWNSKNKARVQAADSDEVVDVTLTEKGPWDFNDTFPAPDPESVALLVREGRLPFDEDADAEEIAGMLDETMNSLVGDYAVMRMAGHQLKRAKSGKDKPPKKMKVEDWIKSLQKEIDTASESVKGTVGEIENIFGKAAGSGMMSEARRRAAQEERSSPASDETEADRLKTVSQPEVATEEAASRKIEDAIDKIEEAIEADNRKAVLDAARAARKVLAETPKSVKDADPEYWKQFNGVITKMTKPGYVTAKQEIEQQQTSAIGKTEIRMSEWQDIGDGYSIREMIEKGPEVSAQSIQEIKTPDGNILTRGIQSDGKEYQEFETSNNPMARGGMSWVNDAIAHLDARRRRPKIEKTEVGEQTVLPGAERIGDGELAQRKADERLKPKVAQKAADIGLFGDESAQTDLLDLTRQSEPAPSSSFDDVFDSVMEEEFGVKPKPRAAGQAAASAAKNTVKGIDDVVTGLTKLFGGNKLSSGLSFDEDTYRQALPFFKAGVAHFKEAAQDLTDMVRALVRHLKQAGMDVDAVQRMRPYIQRFMDDVASGKETLDAPGGSDLLEPDSGDATAGDPVGAADVSASAGPDGQGTGAGGKAGGGRSVRPRGGRRVPETHAPVLGEDGNLELPARQPEPAISDAPAGESIGSDPDGAERLPLEPVSIGEAIRLAEKEADLAARREAQRKAHNIPVEPANRANISETLPMLFTEQQDDVFVTEQRFDKPNGHGMLLTNGTGTGKTYSGLGVVKRFALQGKTNTLIVAPSQGILIDWVCSARDLGFDVSILESTQDAGKGIVATTYANLGQNRNLVERQWDLIVPDEAHKLSSDQNGTPTAALGTLRALTFHPDGLHDRARMVLKDMWDKIEALPDNSPQRAAAYKAYLDRAQPLIDGWRSSVRPKVLFMSATPFAYHFSLDYAEGYLFEFDREQTGSGYNSGDGRDRFYMQHLGYRMRTNRLTKPDADVRSEIMERQLHEMLKREGALSGRALTVDKDYDRKFVLVDNAIGNRIDQALSFLQEADDGKFRPLADIIGKRFDYLTRMRLLEAIKAESAIPYIQKSLAMGRKVVVFHDYNEGGGSSPFHLSFAADDVKPVLVKGQWVDLNMADLYAEFIARNPYVNSLDFSSYDTPIRAIQKAFPDALIYNGTVPVKKRDQAKKLFNDDNSGRDIIVVQSAAGEAGISLHDTTGKKQRVLINLGMPVRPTTSIQQEGRIYRVGQATDAIFRYMNTGTNWERWTFAGKIAERAGTAENLALGDLARTIRQSFIDSFNSADTFEPEPGEGTGGKEADRAMSHSLSEFEKAKTHYFAQGKNSKRRDHREGVDYFATPEPVGLKMVEFAALKPGEKILEPSAGHGAIARYFPEDSARTLVEPSNDLASRAALTSPGARVVVDLFENLSAINKYDAVVMNPPFGSGGKTAIEHVEKAARHLRNGGRIVALIPRGASADKRFNAFMESEAAKGIYLVGNVLLPSVTFERAGTTVSARIVVLEKQTDSDVAQQLEQKDRDYSSANDINELFDRIEMADMGSRLAPKTQDVDAPANGNITVGGVEFRLWNSGLNDSGKFEADIKNKISRDLFAKTAKAAEANGGRYIRYLKAFEFDTAAARQSFLDRVANPPVEDDTVAAQPGVEFLQNQTKHTKTGADLFVASLKDRVSGEQYSALLSIAKRFGGWYSAFRGRGAIPGFQFKTAEDRAKFLTAVTGSGDVQASLGRVSDQSVVNRPAMTPEKRANLEAALTAMVRRIVGPDVVIQFPDTIPLKTPPKGWGSYKTDAETAAGSYMPAQDLLKVALADPSYPLEQVLDTTFHEAFHAVENRLLTDQEMEVFHREDARLRAIIRHGLDFTEQQAEELAGYEVRALAFELYAGQRARGITPQGFHMTIRRAFERLMQFFREVGNYVRGLGFQSADSIMEAVYEGRIADRAQDTARNAEPQFSIRQTPPRGNLNTHDSFDPLPENWRDWWKQPDLRWSDRVWGMLDAAFLNTNRAIGDKYVDMRRLQAAAEATGRPVGENIDMALNAALFEGRAEKRLKDYWLRTWKPVLDRATADGITREDLHEYLYARHAPERNERIAEINEDMPDGGSGMTNDEAQEIMDRFAAEGKREALERASQDIDGIVRSIRETMVVDQLESDSTIATWANTYQHYVPLKGFEAGDETIAVNADGRSGGFDVRGPETRRALGRSSKADDILSNLFLMGERAIIRGEQNRVARSAIRFMQSNPQPSLYEIHRSERVLTEGRPETMREADLDLLLGERPVTVEIRNPSTGMVTVVTKVASSFAKDTFAAKVGGHTYYIRIKHPGLLTALKNVGVQRLPMLIRAHAWLTRQFSAFRTARNPDWFIANLSRDIQDAAYTLSAEQREALLKHFAANIGTLRTYMGAFMGEAMEGNGRIGAWARGKFADKRGVQTYEAWKKAGGQIAFMGIHDLESAKDEIERAFRATEGESWMKSIAMAGPHAAHGLLKAIEYFNGAIEAGTRLAVFDAAIKAGITPAKAALLSKESTTNFNRKGLYSPFLNSFYAFFNARVQGATKHVRLLRTSKMARRAALGLVVGGFAATMWNLAAAPEDEDKKSKYAKRKYWEREKYFILYMPGSSEPFKLPMGFGLQLFWMLGENLAMLSQGKISPAEAALNYLSTVVGAFSPFSAEGSAMDPATWLRTIMPSIEMPLYELSANENWRRKPIHPKFGGKGQPHSDQYFTFTSPLAIDMAQFLNRMSGGDAFRPGKIDLYPGDLQYVWEFAAGGLGQTVNRTDNMVRNWINGVPTPTNQIPVLRHFVGQDNVQSTTEAYYEDREAVQKGMAQVRKAMKSDANGPNAEAAFNTIEAGQKQFGAKDGTRKGTVTSEAEQLFRKADKELKDLRSQESQARNDPTMTRKEKNTLIETIRENMRQVQEETRQAYRQIKTAREPVGARRD